MDKEKLILPGLKILGMGKAVPKRRVTNEEMSRVVETSDEWIRSRTGIGARHMTGRGIPEALRTGEEDLNETQTTLAIESARKALEDSGVDPAMIGLVVTGTSTPGQLMPSTSCHIQHALGLEPGIAAFDLSAACTGFIYALEAAKAMLLERGAYDNGAPCALVTGVDEISGIVDFGDRGTCILFGDGAGSMVVRLSEERRTEIHLGADLDESALFVPAGGHVHMDGKKIFRFATSVIPSEIHELERRTGLSVKDIDYVVCHQANGRIIDHVRRKLDLPEEKFYMNLQEYGNTSAGSIPLALAEMKEKGLLTEGKKVFAVGFGAGLTWGGAYLEF